MLWNKPAVAHNSGGIFAFADGHVETKSWRDRPTIRLPRDDAVMVDNGDILWMQRVLLGGDVEGVWMRGEGKRWRVLFLRLVGYKVLYLLLVSLAAVFGSSFNLWEADKIQRK